MTSRLSLFQSCGEMTLAKSRLNSYRIMWKKKFGKATPFATIELFENILNVSATGDTPESFNMIWQLMKEEDYQPTSLCWMAAFKMLGKHGLDQHQDLTYVQDLLSSVDSLDLHHICTSTRMSKEELNLFTDGIQLIKPKEDLERLQRITYVPEPYTSGLVQSLNTDRGRLVSPFPSKEYTQQLPELLTKQLHRERLGYIQIPSVSFDPSKSHRHDQVAADLTQEWRQCLIRGISTRIEGVLKQRTLAIREGICVYPFFKVLQVEEYADLVLAEMMKQLKKTENINYSITHFQSMLGKAVMDKYFLNELDKHHGRDLEDLYQRYLDYLTRPEESHDSCHRDAIIRLASEAGFVLNTKITSWPSSIIMAIGRELCNVILHHIHISLDKQGNLVVKDEAFNVSVASD